MPASYAIRKDLGSVDNRPMRRNQFRAGIRKVVNIESAKDLITYTAKNESLSIFGRWDLGYGTTKQPKCLPDGSIDAKAVSESMISYTKDLEGKIDLDNPGQIFWMKSGTAIIKGKPFIWNESNWKEQNRRGIQNTLDGNWTLLDSYIR